MTTSAERPFLLEARDLCKTFTSEKGRVEALKDLSFQLAQGEIYGFIGLSGAGKSTLLRCLNLLERPERGEVWFDGAELGRLNPSQLRARRQAIGMIFQSFQLFSRRTALGNVAWPLRLRGWKKKEAVERAEALLDYVGLTDKAAAYPAELSGGQKQRVAIARALAPRPKLLLSDEATSALDPASTDQILGLLDRSAKEQGVSVVMITHQMEAAKAVCDRIGVMENGRLIEENTVRELFFHPKQALTRRFVQSTGSTESRLLERPQEEELLQAAQSEQIYRLAYDGESVGAPIISRLSRNYGVDINLLAGNINALPSERVGYLYVDFLGESASVEAALQDLKTSGVAVEVIA